MTMRTKVVLVSLLVASLGGRSAWAQSRPPAGSPVFGVDLVRDGALIAGALTLAGAAALLPVDARSRWAHELWPLDDPVKLNFSSTAARGSDLLLAIGVCSPLVLQAGQGFGPQTGARALVYGETLALALALNGVTKRLVGRPRPYVYNHDPRVEAYAQAEAEDSRLSFYSGHAATAFAAAVSGAYLFSQSSDDTAARTVVWASGLLLAGATSNLRVRAGKHFYSDVLVGAGLGAATGLIVPLLHQRGHDRNALSGAEWIAIAAAPVAGAVLSQLVPLPADITERLGPTRARASSPLVAPWITAGGAGLTMLRAF
jgi:membrane-associated phospholipid phosphatase